MSQDIFIQLEQQVWRLDCFIPIITKESMAEGRRGAGCHRPSPIQRFRCSATGCVEGICAATATSIRRGREPLPRVVCARAVTVRQTEIYAEVLNGLGRFDEALTLLRQAITKAPSALSLRQALIHNCCGVVANSKHSLNWTPWLPVKGSTETYSALLRNFCAASARETPHRESPLGC